MTSREADVLYVCRMGMVECQEKINRTPIVQRALGMTNEEAEAYCSRLMGKLEAYREIEKIIKGEQRNEVKIN